MQSRQTSQDSDGGQGRIAELGADSLGENDAALAIIDIEKTDTNSITAVRTATETFLLKTLFKTFRKETLLFLNSK